MYSKGAALSCDEEEEKFETSGSIIINEDALMPDYIPQKIIGREKQLKELLFWYETILRSRKPVNVLIKGMPGTGKTLLAQHLASLLKENASKRDVNLHTIYIDCRDCTSETELLVKVIKSLSANFNPARLGWGRLLDILKETLKAKGYPRVLVILDEINLMLEKGETNLLYLFTRSPSHDLGSVSLIVIAVSASILHRLEEIDPSTLSSFGHCAPIIKMEKYTKQELIEIIGERAKLALAPDSLLKNELELIADIASHVGNARLGIEVVWTAAKMADDDKHGRIELDDVRAAKNYVNPEISDDALIDMSEQNLLVYYSIAWYFCENRNAIYVETNKLWPYYTKTCKDNNIQPVSERQYRNLLEDLGEKGLISYISEGRGKPAIISLEEVSAYVLRESIENYMHKQKIHEKLEEIGERYKE